MKVLLIQPPFTIYRTEARVCHPPLGLAYLAAAIRKNHDVFVIDAIAEGHGTEEAAGEGFIRYGLRPEDIKTKIAQIMPDAVGISCLFSAQSENAHKICALAKEVNRDIVTILGGAHPSTVPEEVLRDGNVDFAVIGDGEYALSRLLDSLGSKDPVALEGLGNLGYRHNGHVRVNRQAGSLPLDLDKIAYPEWGDFPLEKYFSIGRPHGGPAGKGPFLPVITSRGCPFECVFCSVHNLWGKGYRKRSAANVLAELEGLVNRFGIKEVLFEDDNLTFDAKRAKEIFKGMIDKDLGLQWATPNGIAAQNLDKGMLELMKASGCRAISIGVESGDEQVLRDIIRKPIDLGMVRKAVDTARVLHIETTAFFVVGLPGETRQQIANTLDFARGLGADNVNFFFATPLPGTRLLDICRQKGLVKGGLDYRRLKADLPFAGNEECSIEELRKIVFRQRRRLDVLSLRRDPAKFLHKAWGRLQQDPGYFIRYGQKYLSHA